MASIVVDDRGWPIVVLRFPAAWAHEEYLASFESVAAVLAREEPCAFISDTRGAAIPNARERKLSADFFATHDAALRRSVRGWAIVAESVLARGAVIAISWLRPPPFPSATFATLPDAEAWCRQQLGPAAR